MGMYDTIRSSYDLGPGFQKELQTKDLECLMVDYWISPSGRLYEIDYSGTSDFVDVPEEERKHPILGMCRSKFKGLADTHHHGYIEMYDATSTWKLKFTDGELDKCERTHFIPLTDRSSVTSDDPDEWSGDDKEQDFDPEEYEG